MARDFEALAAACLAQADILCLEWFGGHRQGKQWIGASTSKGGPGDSWSINLETGAWQHFAGNASGGDLTSAYAHRFGVNQSTAYDAIVARIGEPMPESSVRALPKTAPEPRPATLGKIPDDYTTHPRHPTHGAATAVYDYDNDFWVARYDYVRDGELKKTFTQHAWLNGRLAPKAYPAPRPIYHRMALKKHPDAPVVVVEGEKCADALSAAWANVVVVTWAGGATAVDKNDWTPLTGRKVIIWPDADEPGRQAAARLAGLLLPIAQSVRVLQVETDKPKGWDAADAIAEGWDAAKIAAYVQDRTKTVEMPVMVSESDTSDTSPAINGHSFHAPDDQPVTIPDGAPVTVGRSSLTDWESLGLARSSNGVPFPTLANASQIILKHPDVTGKIWLDTFQNKIWHTTKGPKREWTDADTRELTVFVQQSMQLSKFNSTLIYEAVQHAAGINARNSLTDWLNSLSWDGYIRLDDWLGDALGVEHTDYADAVGRNWLISMVARAFDPGCQADHMIILEGEMGRGKSSFLHHLGGEWYESVNTAIGDKEFLQTIQGAWLIEIPDMTGFNRREHNLILSCITTRRDRYRPAYGRTVEGRPRGCIFAATSETDSYLVSAAGRRRFWPLRCRSIDLDNLISVREQLFAEAVHRYRHGATWYEMPGDATDREQLDRHEPDVWTDAVLGYVENLREENKRYAQDKVITTSHILFYGLEMPLAKQTHQDKLRIASILRAHDYVPRTINRQRCWIYFDRSDHR